MLIFEKSHKGRRAFAQVPANSVKETINNQIPENLQRKKVPLLPEVSELQVVRHYTKLSRKNFSIDTHFYPLGSCTMKYNPRGAHAAANLPGFKNRHPLAPVHLGQGVLACLYDLQHILQEVTGLKGVSLSPMAGAQGEFAGVAMIRAYHEANEDYGRKEILIPKAAHGTNPATAVMCGYKVKEVPLDEDGDVDLDALKAAVGPETAGLMMTNPSTCGVFERKIEDIAKAVHDAGGLLYYDGANLNAILGKVKPGDMNFDVMHINLHKTFATPHGGGGPGAGPIAVSERLLPFLPIPTISKERIDGQEVYRLLTKNDRPQTIGTLSAFMGNTGVLLRAYFYARLLGQEGFHRVSEFSSLNANYMATRLKNAGFKLAFPNRRASHEFIITFKEAKALGLTATDFAKRLLDYGYHAPTIYFPLLIPECFLIEPTETESKEELDGFIDALIAIQNEAKNDADLLKNAPHTMPIKRLDDVKAVKELNVKWCPAE